ncbi:MAG: phenylalanine--tRNA ligase subunit beta, partial [Candidatus Riflebacteria bacterium]|nr:phenylalanine--tRNA ligase subunit beta [Candidatus Riflebacteria bacterium]
MLVPIRWLKEYVQTQLSPQEIARRLTLIGLEVEALTRHTPGLEGIVTARVERVEKHPNADKLTVCDVTDGTTSYKVVCGAPNVAPGLTVPLAKLGAILPGGVKIKRSKIRGVESEGMICSEYELKLSESREGIMHLGQDVPLNLPIDEVLGLADWVMEVNVTANRPDCLSIIGIARELACATGVELKLPEVVIKETSGDIRQGLGVDVRGVDGCPRYSARRVSGLVLGPSPAWMQRYLESAGVRPINNVVDITNFVMLEIGHPMHAFDARMIHGNQIVVRWARPAEKLTTLDGVVHTLQPTDLLIADPERPIALAGVMGGEQSGIADSTTEVVLEAAYFDPITVRRTAKRLRLHTESSHRFERGCDPEATLRALDRACQLLEEHAQGRVTGGVIDCYPTPFVPRTVTIRTTRVNQVLGTQLERFRMEWLLKGLGLKIRDVVEANLYYDADKMTVEVPSFRPDLSLEIDVIEEVARLFGYDKVPALPPVGASLPVREDPLHRLIRASRRCLAGLGFNEAISFPFTDRQAAGAVRLANPLKEEESHLRVTLLDTMVRNLVYNVSHQNTYLNLFELGRVFRGEPGASAYHQEYRLAMLLAGDRTGHWRQKTRPVDYYAMKGVLEALLTTLRIDWTAEALPPPNFLDGSFFHPGRGSRILVNGEPVGYFAELHPGMVARLKVPLPVVVAEIAMEQLQAAPAAAQDARPIAAYPKAERDLALLVRAEVTYAALKRAIDDAGGKLLEESRVFDVFSGGSIEVGQKSV